jgi:hypothetical protein
MGSVRLASRPREHTTRMRSDMRTYWRHPAFWRWWWRERVRDGTKFALAVIVAFIVGIAGYLTAERLAATQEAATFTTQRVVTIVRTTRANPPQPASGLPAEVVTMLQTTTQPGKTEVVTVRRAGRAVVVRAPGETVTEALTVRGPVQQRVVTNTRTATVVRTETANRRTTVTTPGATQTVTREVTQPARTVTQTTTEKVTLTQEVTKTETATVTQTVTVTTTCKKPC